MLSFLSESLCSEVLCCEAELSDTPRHRLLESEQPVSKETHSTPLSERLGTGRTQETHRAGTEELQEGWIAEIVSIVCQFLWRRCKGLMLITLTLVIDRYMSLLNYVWVQTGILSSVTHRCLAITAVFWGDVTVTEVSARFVMSNLINDLCHFCCSSWQEIECITHTDVASQ